MASGSDRGKNGGPAKAAAEDAGRRIELAAEAPIFVGPVTVEPARRMIRNADGREAVVEPRAMKVLVALLRAGGAVLTRDDLFEACWEGRAVSDDAVDRAIARLRRSMAPVADGVIAIETVTKVGHRAVTSAPVGEAEAAAAVAAAGRAPRWRAAALLGALILLLLVGVGRWLDWGRDAAPPVQSLGIVPFRGIDGNDRHLAGGLGDQVRADLASRTDLQIFTIDPRGAAVIEDSLALRLGRRVGVRYVVLGHLQRDGTQARVHARLLDTAESRRIWSDTLSAPLSEMSLLQERIGARLASALGLRLMPVQGHRTAASGEAQALYLTARGLIRSREGRNMAIAATMLREAISRDPEFAPAWAKLGVAIALGDRGADEAAQGRAALAEAIRCVRRALALDPQLAEAHGILGMLLSFNSEEAAEHIRRAAALDPNDAEIQLWRGHIYGAELDFENQLAAYRRAAALDPMWWVPVFETVRLASELGRAQVAETEARRFGSLSSWGMRRLLVGRLAELRGQFAAAARVFETVRQSNEPERGWAAFALEQLLHQIGLADLAARIPEFRVSGWSDPYGEQPSVAAVRQGSADPSADFTEFNHRVRAVKRLAAAGRAGPLAELYDSPVGLLGLSSRERPLPGNLVDHAATVALVLRQAGREAQADRLLAAAQAEIRRVAGRPLPATMLARIGELWAVAGNDEAALDFLQRAFDGGWRYVGHESFGDVAEEPAFVRLRQHPRFVRLRARLADHVDRERAEIRRVLTAA